MVWIGVDPANPFLYAVIGGFFLGAATGSGLRFALRRRGGSAPLLLLALFFMTLALFFRFSETDVGRLFLFFCGGAALAGALAGLGGFYSTVPLGVIIVGLLLTGRILFAGAVPVGQESYYWGAARVGPAAEGGRHTVLMIPAAGDSYTVELLGEDPLLRVPLFSFPEPYFFLRSRFLIDTSRKGRNGEGFRRLPGIEAMQAVAPPLAELPYRHYGLYVTREGQIDSVPRD